MASITKRIGKNGNVSYQIRVSNGYNVNGKQRKPSMTWIPPDGMSDRKIEKELQKQAMAFEERIKSSALQGNTIRFADFSRKWYQEYAVMQLKIKTYTEYGKQLMRINEEIGHIKLQNLKTGHLNSFYASLQQEGMNLHTGGKLSSNTVRSYHHLISSILSKAVKWGYVQNNVAQNAELPKILPQEAAHLDEEDARKLLSLLHNEPIKYQTMISFDLLSGLRRGELLGLQWRDVDFENHTISVRRTISYVPEVGIYVDTPKNRTSVRPIKLSPTAISLLSQYKYWQDIQKKKYKERWKNKDDRVFTSDDGSPIHPESLTKWFSRFVKRHDLPNISIHSLRHTYASMMISDGIPLVVVSKRLGHAQVSTTANIYSHVIASADERAAQLTEKFADVIRLTDMQDKRPS